MRTKNNIELEEFGCFVKNDPSKKTDLDENLESLQAPEDDLSAFGAFVKPQKEGLLRRAEAIRHPKADETIL